MHRTCELAALPVWLDAGFRLRSRLRAVWGLNPRRRLVCVRACQWPLGGGEELGLQHRPLGSFMTLDLLPSVTRNTWNAVCASNPPQISQWSILFPCTRISFSCAFSRACH